MVGLRGDGGERLVEEIPQMWPDFLTEISKSFDPTFTFRGQKISTFFVCWKVFVILLKTTT